MGTGAGVPAASWRRSVRLLGLPAGAVALQAGAAVRRWRGEDPAAVRRDVRARASARTRRVLGELKGGPLKAGQLVSTVDALLPQDPDSTWAQALGALREDNPPLPFAAVVPVLDADLPGWRSLLPDLDARAVAAASLGQVHRATWHGPGGPQPVAVKVQYPGVREALAADLRAVSLATRAAALLAPRLALPPLVTELRTRLVEELDYEREAGHQRRFAAAYAGDTDVAVPDVLAATPRVLVTSWLPGTPLTEVAARAGQPTRDRVGLLYQRFLLSGPCRLGLLHTDPHPGNFRLTPAGRLGVLDFGSCLDLPDGMPRSVGRLITLLQHDDEAEVLAGLRAEGLVRPGAALEVDKLLDYLGPFTEPARHEVFTYSREWLRRQFGRVNDPRDPEFAVALQLQVPAEQLFTYRVWLGVVGVLCQLGATVPVRPELERWLPGFG